MSKVNVETLRAQLYSKTRITDARLRLLRICYELPEEDVEHAIAALVPVILEQLKRSRRSTAPQARRRGTRKGGAK